MNQDVWGDGSHEITRTEPRNKSLIYLHYFIVMLGKQLTLSRSLHKFRSIICITGGRDIVTI